MGYTVKILHLINESKESVNFKNALRQFLFDNQETFFGKELDVNSAKETTASKERAEEIAFKVPFTDDARDNRNEIVNKLLKKFTYNGNTYCVAPSDYIIQSASPVHVTGNDHVIVINAKTKEFAVVLKYSRGGALDTVYKEGLKVLFTNYLINKYFDEPDEDKRGQIIYYITSQEQQNEFIKWVEKPNNAILLNTMNPADYKKLIDWLQIMAFHAVPEKKATPKDLKYYLDKYNLSCKVMFSLAASNKSYLTRNSTKYGELTKFYEYAKQYARETTKQRFGTEMPPSKAHPADVIMVGSIIDLAPMSIYWQDGAMSGESTSSNAVVCAGISLKESRARWGKVTEALLNFDGQFNSTKEGVKNDKLKNLRNSYLENAFIEAEEDPNSNNYYDVLANVCNKFKFCHLGSSSFSKIDLEQIADIHKLEEIVITKNNGVNQKSLKSLNMKQMYNIFFTAIFASLDNNDIAYLINECLQLNSKSYYMVKDNADHPTVLGNMPVTPDMISNSKSIRYTGAGDKKVTQVLIGLEVTEDAVIRNALPPTQKKGKLEVDIRQNNTETDDNKGLNSTIEFK